MPQLGPLDPTIMDAASTLVAGATVNVYREGATINGDQIGVAPLTVAIHHPGKIVAGDTVFIENDNSTTYSVGTVTATTMQISGFTGTLSVLNGQRIVPSNNQPTIYSDDQGGASVSQPLTSDLFGSIATSGGLTPLWMEGGAYHVLAAKPLEAARLYQVLVVAGEAPGVVYSGERDGATAVAHIEDTRFALTTAGAKLKSWRNLGVEKANIGKDGDATFSTVYFRDAVKGGDGVLDQFLYGEVTRDLSAATSGQAFLSADIKTRFSGTTAFTNLSLNGLFSKNQYGVGGTGGGDVATGIAIGAYSEHRGSAAITGALYGAENATTMYNTGSVVSAFGSLNSAQINSGANAAIAIAEGVAGYARGLGTAAGSIGTAIGVNGLAGLQDTSSVNITDAIGGRFGVIKDGGVSGVITNAYGINILNITQGGANNFGLRIGGASGGSNINQSLRVDSGESHFIGPVTSPPVTFADLAATPSVSGSNVFVASNSGATTITDFTNDKDGQRITIVFTNANTTIQNNAGLINRGGANITPGANTTRSYLSRNGVWYEVS